MEGGSVIIKRQREVTAAAKGGMNVDNSFSSEDIDVAKMFENEDIEDPKSGFEDEDDEEEGKLVPSISVSTQSCDQRCYAARYPAARPD